MNRKPNSNDLMKLIEDANRSPKARKELINIFGFITHKNFGLYVLISLIINLLTVALIIGFSSLISPLIEVNIIGIFLGMILYTLLEIALKLLFLRFMLKQIIYSLGTIFYLLYVGLFYIVSVIVPSPGFVFPSTSNLFIFTVIFILIRMIFSTVIKRNRVIQKIGARRNDK